MLIDYISLNIFDLTLKLVSPGKNVSLYTPTVVEVSYCSLK